MMNFFEKKTYNIPRENALNVKYNKKQPKKLFEFEGRYAPVEKIKHKDDNIN